MTASSGGRALWRFRHTVADFLPPFNFLTLHYLYFILMGLVSSAIFYGASTPARSVSYVDSLYLCVSAMTGAGLNTVCAYLSTAKAPRIYGMLIHYAQVNLAALNTFQQAELFVLLMLGSAILISSVVLIVRKMAFESKFQGIVEDRIRNRPLQRIVHLSAPLATREDITPATCTDHQSSSNAPAEERVARPSVRKTALPKMNSKDRPDTSFSVAPALEENTLHTVLTQRDDDHIRWAEDPSLPRPHSRSRHHMFPMAGVGARGDIMNDPKDVLPNSELHDQLDQRIKSTKAITGTRKSFPSSGSISRNSQFFGLSQADREKLGGVEYKAISFLSWLVPAYFIAFHLLGCLALGAWMWYHYPQVARNNGLDPFWTGAFFACSAFNNSGYSLLDSGVIPLQKSAFILLTMGFLILAGNTLYPAFLRLIVWTMKCLLPENTSYSDRKMVLDFILDHPRRIYTNMFPSRHTWYLVGTVFLFNAIDWAAFEVLSIGNEEVRNLGAWRALDGLFQALSVRSGGFYVVTIANLNQGLLVLYILMMASSHCYHQEVPVRMWQVTKGLFTVRVGLSGDGDNEVRNFIIIRNKHFKANISVYRNTNIYEERSLGIYAGDVREAERPSFPAQSTLGRLRRYISGRDAPQESRGYFLRQQLRGQLSHDLWWIALAVVLISICENKRYNEHPVVFATMNIVFEVVSAYGCVGISTGVPWNTYAFSGAWQTVSKLILVAVMLRGKHRGLPVSIDRAIMLPDVSLEWAEEEDAVLRLERTRTLERSRSRSKSVGPQSRVVSGR
ncbi:hypothetical protein PRK78_006987 [Emydomyces testavorans]|uniref:Potassium transport protein n=1 Tax=Emydomyces testavorans TaxID=2070801 RepID=A0AAF0IMB4_9EURO|nr:hypothetical protein PRK78_006987 [Emydomyces testavorans]